MATTRVPSVNELKRPTLEHLAHGVIDTGMMREILAREFHVDVTSKVAKRFINNHAWALVRLQAEGLIKKTDKGKYSITEKGRAFVLKTTAPAIVDAPRVGYMPQWAKRLIYRANRQNGPDGPRFTEADMIELWARCSGKCALTRLKFGNDKVGSGKAKRAFAPSLDKIDPAGSYTVENCRLVMVAVNFALNAWGDEVYMRLARAAVRAADASAAEREPKRARR